MLKLKYQQIFEDNQFIVKINDEHFITGVVQDEEQFVLSIMWSVVSYWQKV